MVVIKRGTPPGEKIWRGECDRCSSMMEETENNLTVERDQKEHTHYAHATCPVCGVDFIMYPVLRR